METLASIIIILNLKQMFKVEGVNITKTKDVLRLTWSILLTGFKK